MLAKLGKKLVIPEEIVHYSEWVHVVRDLVAERRTIDMSHIRATIHPACHYHKIVPDDELMAEAERMANRLAELSPMAVQGMKEMMVRASNLDYSAIDQITEVAQNRVMNSNDRKEGARAFSEKRSVEWPGD